LFVVVACDPLPEIHAQEMSDIPGFSEDPGSNADPSIPY
jgi:hypothetical protein